MNDGKRERRRRFEAAFDAYRADIVAYCSWRASSPSDAQDAVADVFLIAWRRAADLPEGDSARVWLYATARRVISNQRRSQRRRAALHERLAREPVAPPRSEAGEENALVHAALRRLGARDREVLLLAEWEGLAPAEIAAVLGCLTVTVRGRPHRARHRFRLVYDELIAHERPQRAESPHALLRTAAAGTTPIRKGGS